MTSADTITDSERWPATVAEAEAVQDRLRGQVDLSGPGPARVVTVAGVDVAYDTDSDMVAGAVVVLDVHTLSAVAEATAIGRAQFPYVPGLLAFRELPPLLDAWKQLPTTITPDLVVCDGYGVAHPRRFGLACHLGILTGLPTIGVAKTAFIGDYDPPGPQRGSWSPLVEGGEAIGRALRTRTGVKEVFVSVGHRIDLDSACRHVLALTPRYRLPETTRVADHASRRALRGVLG
ncbi:deoxyribonuclease V [Protofrankia symbiont of Coriaria ruscifolia]|uniref:deoxyribonuclease V n=1 Tax=Protofrankia symbiont of Coriaria ruscifolia TaxID=1306542 RepID=UPI001040E247|nr:deoxyribonuclease V [Protofrankia symbiont of Coriaria ruscifolia]